MPVFVARNIDNLPDRQPEEMNMLFLLNRVAELEKSVRAHDDTQTNFAIDIMKLNDIDKKGGKSDLNNSIDEGNAAISEKIGKMMNYNCLVI